MGGGGCNENTLVCTFFKKIFEGVYSVLESTLAYDIS